MHFHASKYAFRDFSHLKSGIDEMIPYKHSEQPDMETYTGPTMLEASAFLCYDTHVQCLSPIFDTNLTFVTFMDAYNL